MASLSQASIILAQWNFNSGAALTAGGTLQPDIGTGAASYNGQGLASPFANTGGGASNDPSAPASSNIYRQWNGSQPTDANGINSLQFVTSTVGQGGIIFTFDMQIGYRASRYYQLQVTSDGTTYTNVSGGTGISPSTLGQGTSSVTVSDTGLITLVTKSQANANKSGGESSGGPPATGPTAAQSTANWNLNLGYAFGPGAWDNSANFGVRIVEIFNPFQSVTTANDYGYVSSFQGTNSTDATLGYIRTSSSGGGKRIDVVAISVPEPSSLLGLGVLAIGAGRRRR